MIERGMYRNRRLLDLVRELPQCTNCGAHSMLVPAHSNLGEHGKGKGLKAHDCFFAALCDYCHKWLDNQSGTGKDPSDVFDSTPADKALMFQKAMHRTWLALWRGALVRVA